MSVIKSFVYHIAWQNSYGDREKNLHQNGGVRIFQGSHQKRERIYQGHIYIINVKLTIRSTLTCTNFTRFFRQEKFRVFCRVRMLRGGILCTNFAMLYGKPNVRN